MGILGGFAIKLYLFLLHGKLYQNENKVILFI